MILFKTSLLAYYGKWFFRYTHSLHHNSTFINTVENMLIAVKWRFIWCFNVHHFHLNAIVFTIVLNRVVAFKYHIKNAKHNDCVIWFLVSGCYLAWIVFSRLYIHVLICRTALTKCTMLVKLFDWTRIAFSCKLVNTLETYTAHKCTHKIHLVNHKKLIQYMHYSRIWKRIVTGSRWYFRLYCITLCLKPFYILNWYSTVHISVRK